MKVAVALLILLPLALAAPRQISSNPFLNSILNIFHADEIKALVTDLVRQLGSAEREAECEKECNLLVDTQVVTEAPGFSMSANVVLHQACPLVCHSLQEFVHLFGINPMMPSGSMMPPSGKPMMPAGTIMP